MKKLVYHAIVKHENQLGQLVKGENQDLLFHPAGFGRYSYSELTIATEENIEETTHDEKVKYLKQDFSWGEIIKVHSIGEYVIFEYINGYDLKNEGITNICFHAYINYRNISVSYDSLDSCLVGTIAYKFDGANSQAAGYFEKMVGMRGAK